MATTRKRLIEVALPLEAINKAAAYEKMPGIGPHPRGLHLWWARRPLAAARAVIFAQMVDDPASLPDLFHTEQKQQKERERLFRIIEELVQWENTTNEAVLEKARAEIWQSWRRACAENADHPRAKELFDRHKLPAFHDPFAGGGALPLEAQRLGLEAYASDLNPVAVLINKAMIEIPPRFAGRPPVNPEARREKTLIAREWKGAQGLAEDVRYYGKWMRDEAKKRIGHFYPNIEVTAEMTKDRPDLKPYGGQKLTVIAWIWARTVKSPNPAFANVDVPLASTFMLSNKAGKEAYVEPVIEGDGYHFTVKVGKPKNAEGAKNGTKASGRGANFHCVMSGVPISGDYLKVEGMAGRLGSRLMAIVAEGERGRVYLPPVAAHETMAHCDPIADPPIQELPREGGGGRTAFWCKLYGLVRYADLFTPRQLVALTAFSDLVGEAMAQVRRDAVAAGFPDDATPLRDGGTGVAAYAEAVGVYLSFTVDRCADFSNSCTRWVPGNQKVMNLFGKQAIAMTWDYPEAAILHETVGGFRPACDFIASCIAKLPQGGLGSATQQDATTGHVSVNKVVSTDPPYYDNIGYADLSDFFYLWLRRSLRGVFPDLFATLAVPKAEELVAIPYRHGSKEKAESFFLDGMTLAMHRLVEQSHPAFPVTIYYAFKQSESETDAGTASTGWETFLDAAIRAGFGISGTWPMRSEQEYRMIGMGTNALASSIVLVCRKRAADAPTATRREFVAALKAELPTALRRLQEGNIAPVDLAQAAIGPGMAVYTRYAKVLDAEGKPVPVRDALALINQVLDETLAEQEGDFDADSRFALAWFEQHGFAEGEFGVAEVLARAKNTSVEGLEKAGVLKKGRGKVQLLRPSDLPADWDPTTDTRLTAWESVHQLIRVLESSGEAAAGELVAKLGSKAELARELCYRLYTLCERKKRAAEALSYNGLVQSFPELERLAKEPGRKAPTQATMLTAEDE
jgi:putative DNA methylase